jgi:hypothetical protein
LILARTCNPSSLAFFPLTNTNAAAPSLFHTKETYVFSAEASHFSAHNQTHQEIGGSVWIMLIMDKGKQ